MADVSTEPQAPITPGVFTFQVSKAELNLRRETFEGQSVERHEHVISSKIVEGEDAEMVGRSYKDHIHIHMKNGQNNEVGLVDIKRYFECCAPDLVNDEELDTDVLVGNRFQGQIFHETYDSNEIDKQTGQKKQRTKASLRRNSMIPV